MTYVTYCTYSPGVLHDEPNNGYMEDYEYDVTPKIKLLCLEHDVHILLPSVSSDYYKSYSCYDHWNKNTTRRLHIVITNSSSFHPAKTLVTDQEGRLSLQITVLQTQHKDSRVLLTTVELSILPWSREFVRLESCFSKRPSPHISSGMLLTRSFEVWNNNEQALNTCSLLFHISKDQCGLCWRNASFMWNHF